MSSKPYKSPTQMDEELAEFTDRILSGDQVNEADVSEELQVLKHTVSRLSLVTKKTPPTSSMQRIEKQLMNEWHKNQNLVEKEPFGWLKYLQGFRVWKSNSRWRPALALVLTAFFLILLLPFTEMTSLGIEASVRGVNQHQLILIVLATITVIGLIWFSRHK